MNQWDIMIILILAAGVFAAVFFLVKRKKSGRSCCGDCAACAGHATENTCCTDNKNKEGESK